MNSSSSSSPISKYDVFLSFRGEDTRKNIVSHLYKELINRGIVAFKDDQRLEIGDSISQEITRAIQASRFALVILSKNYASSRWCLDELLFIMDLHLTSEIKVIPVFYGIDPSHVRHQTGSFTLDKYHGSEMVNKVTNWRQALTQIASISGKDSAVCEDEASMIEEIVEGISNQLFIMQPVDFTDIVGMDAHMEHLNPLLSIESEDEVRMIGISGMGGIGKTTIAKCLFDQFSKLFPARCFLENVSKIYRKHGVSYLRKKFISTTLLLFENNMKFSSIEPGPQEIKAWLGHRKVFVVLDNVDDMRQMLALAKAPGWFGPGSRIIITTRDKGLLDSCGVRTVYEVKCLDTGAALQIFNQLAFEGGLAPSEVYEKLSIRASWLAQGIPAAIEAYGLFFRGMKSLKEWEDALCRFIRAPHTNVMEILKISYDGLEEAEKSVFLHVACLFNGEPLWRATTLLDDGELQGRLGVKILAERSLIEITAGGDIKMHYLVEQTARDIVRQESVQRPRGRRVLWDPCDIYDILKRNGGNEPMECLALHMCEMPSALNLEGYQDNQPSNLKFLKVYKHLDQIESTLDISSKDTCLLSTKLRLLHWDAFPLTAFPFRFLPQNLVEASLRYSNLTRFFIGPVGLLKLRMLDLSGSKNLELLPDLSMAVNLKKLITQGCKRLKGIPESISNLTSLTKLDVSYCDELRYCHITIRELTKRFCLDFSGKEVEMKYLANLSIGGNIEIQMFSLDGKAEHLCLSTEQNAPNGLKKRGQQQAPYNEPALQFGMRTPQAAVQAAPEFYSPERMKKARLKYLPTSDFHRFNSIDVIRFNYKSDGANFRCYSLSMFPCLKELNLINLNIEVIPDDVCALQSLEKLDWSGNDFETLPETMNQLPRLKCVSLCNCCILKALPVLVQVETIKLSGCTSLPSLLKISHTEQDLGRFQWLELWVDDCKNIQSISDQLRHFMQLSYIDLTSHDFETLPSSIRELSSLGTLCLNNCKKLKSIEGVPLSLKYLYAHGCESLETVSLPLNHCIKHLDLSHCFGLNQDNHLITQFLNEGQNEEESLRFACFPGTEVPNYFGDVEARETITIGLTGIWPSQKMLGFDACIMIACERPFHIRFSPSSYAWNWGYERYIHLDLQPDFFYCRDSSFHSIEEEAAKSHHLIILRGLKNISLEINKFSIQSNLKFSEEFKSPPAEIKSCGVRLIWEDHQTDEDLNRIKGLSSLCKFGDAA